MNTRIGICLILILGLSSLGCKKRFDLTNPNEPEEVSDGALMGTVCLASFSSHHGGLARYAAMFTQQMKGQDLHYQPIYENYQLRADDNEFLILYTQALMNAKIIMDQSEDPATIAVAKVWSALNFSLVADMWGEGAIPPSGALGGLDGQFTSDYVDSTEIYQYCLTVLDEALAVLDPVGGEVIPGDISQTSNWYKAAIMVKARIQMRLRDYSGALATITSVPLLPSDGIYGFYGTGANTENVWSQFLVDRGGYLATDTFMLNIAGTDPRAPFYDLDQTGFAAVTSQTQAIVGYDEAKFIEAECKFRNGDVAGADVALTEAVAADYDQLGLTLTPPTFTNTDLDEIMTQAYMGLFGNVSAWRNFIRTGIPSIPSKVPGKSIPDKLPTPQSEIDNNGKG